MQQKASVSKRSESFDLPRAVVKIITALDHARDYFNARLPFFTSQVNKFCAQAFMLPAGISRNFLTCKKAKGVKCFLVTAVYGLYFWEDWSKFFAVFHRVAPAFMGSNYYCFKLFVQ